MIDLGDPVALVVNTYLADGTTLADATPQPTLSLSPPDGSAAVSPAVTRVSVGTYSVAYLPGLPGRWGVYWDAPTGTIVSAYDDAFYITDKNRLIISLAQAKKAVISPGQTQDPPDLEELRNVIAAATGIMEDLCGPILLRAFDEWHDGGAPRIFLDYAPVATITSVNESWGSTNYRTLSEQPLSGAGFDSYGYTVNKRMGVLIRRTSGTTSTFAMGDENIHVVGTYGRTLMSPNLQEGTKRLVRWLWQSTRQGMRPNMPSGPERLTQTPSGLTIPYAVAQICADEVRPMAQG